MPQTHLVEWMKSWEMEASIWNCPVDQRTEVYVKTPLWIATFLQNRLQELEFSVMINKPSVLQRKYYKKLHILYTSTPCTAITHLGESHVDPVVCPLPVWSPSEHLWLRLVPAAIRTQGATHIIMQCFIYVQLFLHSRLCYYSTKRKRKKEKRIK